MIKVKKLVPEAHLPVRNFPLDAGADLSSVEEIVIERGKYYFVDTGIIIQADISSDPVKSYFRIAPRSGLAFRNGISVLAGVVDLSYTGSIKVGIYNGGDTDFYITPGMKIAQLIRECCFIDEFVEVDSIESTDRGASGFGSTGV